MQPFSSAMTWLNIFKNFKWLFIAMLFCHCVPSIAWADENQDFVEANILGIFYHELGHALIDIEGIRIFGQEEDAADTFSIYLIDALFEEGDAESLAYDIAIGFWTEAEQRITEEDEPAWWGVHGPDEQRFFNTVCLFYGANPDQREEFASVMELPDERAQHCAEEYEQVYDSWGSVFEELVQRGPGDTLKLSGDQKLLTYDVLEAEVKDFNEMISLSEPLMIIVRECNEANAFYDPGKTQIIMCSEFENYLYDLTE